MSTHSDSSSHEPTPIQQRRQANIFLLRLQWLLILLLIAAVTWQFISQQRFVSTIDERVQSNEQVMIRLNEMDDRLFAMSQQRLPEPSTASTNQAQNQLDLLRIQIQAVDRLLADNNDSAAIELLRGLHWQLSQSSNEIAPALTIVIKQGLLKDIEKLQAKSAQISPWQAQNFAIQNMQAFLHSHERNNSLEPNGSHERVDSREPVSTPKSSNLSTANKTNPTLTRRQLSIHETIMTLNLALQASNMREPEQLSNHLQQARQQLQALAPTATTPKKQHQSSSAKATGKTVTEQKRDSSSQRLETMTAPTTITEVIAWLDQLIANAPTTTPLMTTQILETS